MKLPIYIISDNHFLLEDSKKEKFRREKLFDLFKKIQTTGGTLIIGGDFFDFWLEFITGPPHYYENILDELEKLHLQHIDIHYVLGNHDYWDCGYFQKKFGAKIYKNDFSLIDKTTSLMSQQYSKSYLHHLFNTREVLGLQIATSHNLHFYINLMQKIREEIKKDTFEEWSKQFLSRYEK